MLFLKRLFPGTGSSGGLGSADVTHLSAYRIQTQHEYKAHFEICNTFCFCLTLFPDSLLGSPVLVPAIEIIHSHLVRDGHFVMATAAKKEDTCKPEVWMDLVQEVRDRWRLHPWTRLPLSAGDVLGLLRASAASRAS